MQLGAWWNFVFLIYYMVFKINMWVERCRWLVMIFTYPKLRKLKITKPNLYAMCLYESGIKYRQKNLKSCYTEK